ncbi:MarR family winged helix-turn-helix transcriptional regulator [Blastochloris viridis]|uniref:Transcriptional regulator n=1 Tax=Blastochloris viridis TaxID=1079 RepID=A0A0H5B8H2_BLAVI|nr:MarR family transcriptional regulator [Blastochloris viridis]ALK08245.1 Transcriptional regulator SlyA [Blastochloris viridis]BAR98490.1 transcriptional regulator [Blastochloris viridis]CUU44167.1 transcriptional regulator SlyA [Blastochloris viridis]
MKNAAAKDAHVKTVGYRLNHTARLQRARTAKLLTGLGLFPGQETVLKLLAEHDGRTMGDLAGALRVRPPTASKTIARLTAQGLVERRAVNGDGRLVRVHLTEPGRTRASAIDGIWHTLEQEMLEGLDGKDRKRLRKLLRRIEKNLAGRLGTDAHEDDADDDADDAPADRASE